MLLPTLDEAARYPYADDDRTYLEKQFAPEFIGSRTDFFKRLGELLEVSAADELMVTTKLNDHADRVRSYELLAQLANS